jgi:hypothetical protein
MSQIVRDIAKEIIGTNRTIFYVISFVIELVIFFTAVSYPVPSSRLPELQQEARNILGYAQTQSNASLVGLIFANNIKVALLEMVPVFGILVFGGVIFETGQVLQVASSSVNVPATIIGASLFLFPFAFLELFSYAVAVVSGNMLVFSALKGKLVHGVKVYVAELCIVVFLLLVAATMEAITIFNWAIGLSFWILVLAGIVLGVLYRSRTRKTFI